MLDMAREALEEMACKRTMVGGSKISEKSAVGFETVRVAIMKCPLFKARLQEHQILVQMAA